MDPWKSRTSFSVGLVVCMAATAAAADDGATQLGPVMVDGSKAAAPVRYDVRTACPGIEGQLQDSLSSAWSRIQQAGTMRVQFRLDGQGVSNVRSSSRLSDYRPYLRKAMHGVTCSQPAAQAHEIAFLLVIRDPDAVEPGGQVFALLEQ